MSALMRQRTAFLGSVPLLKRLNDEERAGLVRELTERRFAPSEHIITAGDMGDCMYIIEEGAAAAVVDGVGEVKQYGVGDFFGEQALITHQKRLAHVVAKAPVVALVLGQEAFESLVGNVGELMEETRRRLRAASYSAGRRDYPKLFRYYNRSRSGTLDWAEFRSLVRKDGRMTAQMMSERELRTLFCLVNINGDGSISQEEFCKFLGVQGEDDQQPAHESRLTPEVLAQRVALLSGVKILKSLTDKEKRALAGALVPHGYSAGDRVIKAGEAGDAMFIVQEGELEAVSADESTHFLDYGSGDAFGELALLSNANRAATVRCASDAVCLILRRRTFDKLVGNVGKCMEELRRRFKASAYVTGRLDYKRLFEQYNRSNSGLLDWREFNAAVRKYGKVSKRVASDREVQVLFDMIDLNKDELISRDEFYTFLGLTKHGEPKPVEAGGERSKPYHYSYSLDDVELRLKEARARTYAKARGRAAAKSAKSSGLKPRSPRSPRSGNGRTAAAQPAGNAAASPTTAPPHSAEPAPSAGGRPADTWGRPRTPPGAEPNPPELSGAAHSAMEGLRGMGLVSDVTDLWGARRAALVEEAAAPGAGSPSAWGSTPGWGASGSGGGTDRPWGLGGRELKQPEPEPEPEPEPDAGPEVAAETRFAGVWTLMSPRMRALAVEEEERLASAKTATRLAIQVPEAVPPSESVASSAAEPAAAVTPQRAGEASRGTVSAAGAGEVSLSAGVAAELERRYQVASASRPRSGGLSPFT